MAAASGHFWRHWQGNSAWYWRFMVVAVAVGAAEASGNGEVALRQWQQKWVWQRGPLDGHWRGCLTAAAVAVGAAAAVVVAMDDGKVALRQQQKKYIQQQRSQLGTIGIGIWWRSNQIVHGRVVMMAAVTIEVTREDNNGGWKLERWVECYFQSRVSLPPT